MFEQAMLARQFQDLLEQERQAEKIYAQYAQGLPPGELRNSIEQIRFEKQRHIELTQRLLEIINY